MCIRDRNPTERLDTVTAAVVNLDEPVKVDGQLVPLGRVLAAELIDGDAETNFTWQLTDEDDAAAGPVSYTHLDVYKRQTEAPCKPSSRNASAAASSKRSRVA